MTRHFVTGASPPFCLKPPSPHKQQLFEKSLEDISLQKDTAFWGTLCGLSRKWTYDNTVRYVRPEQITLNEV
jgi:hypothetical protein